MNRWRRAARLATHLFALATVALCLLLPTSRYDWVGDVDPAIRPADLAGGGDDSAVAVATFALLALLIEAVALATGRTRSDRILPAALIVSVAVAWLARTVG